MQLKSSSSAKLLILPCLLDKCIGVCCKLLCRARAVCFLQGGLALSWQYLLDAQPSMDAICDLAGLSISSFREEQLLVEELSSLLALPLTDAALLAMLSGCTALANDAATETSTVASGLVPTIAGGELLVKITNRMFLRTGVPSSHSHSRQLTAQAKSSAKESGAKESGGLHMVDIVSSADMSGQDWTVEDLPVQFPAVPGTVLHPRMLGHGNEVLGGVQITQTRTAASHWTCSSRFAQLVSACQGSQLSSRDAGQVVPGSAGAGGMQTPFGRDPAFNPLSGLFSAAAAKNEGAYYNMSAGSPELSADGFPAAFFPRTANLKPTFIIVLPVSPSHAYVPCL